MNLTQISGSTAYFASVIVLILFALPSFIGSVKQSGPIRALLLFVSLGLLIIGFETLAVKTGIPYGKFSYNSVLNFRLFGTTPWIVALSYPPIVIGAFWLARKVSIGVLTPLFTAIFTTLTYAVLSPAMSKLTLWQWENPGPFFGVPIRSFIGWFVCAFIGAMIVNSIWGESESRRISAYSWAAIVLFWSGVNLGIGNIIIGFAGIGAYIFMLALFVLEKRNQNND
ncbi:carotenoid biosynthesis protein [Candidatus Saccharibacteria bacterium]|nr:carotenoid biosynthesis protein [Candidatus Saccharibacteria bacterium]